MTRRKPTREDLVETNAFDKYGAQIIPQLIGHSELNELRDEIYAITQTDVGRHIQAPEIFEHPRLLALMFRARLVSGLRSVFGSNICYYPNVQLQMNSFTQPGASRFGGWHIDASREAQDRCDYIFGRHPVWANVGLFFQDVENDRFGGGIMIIPGSHRFFSKMKWSPMLGEFSHRVMSRSIQFLPVAQIGAVVPTLPGDAVVIDCRLLHASVPTMRNPHEGTGASARHQAHAAWIPRANHKYAMYWFCSNVGLGATCLENNFFRRAELLSDEYAKTGGFDYKKVCRVSREAYPPEYCELAEACDVHLVSASERTFRN